MQDLLNTIPEFMDMRMEDTGPAVSVGASPPADTGGIWIYTPPAPGPPQLMIFYNGTWRQMYTGNPQEVQVFIGNPANYFDSTGLGFVGGAWDGWALCNGNNGTPNLQNFFIVPGYRWDGGGWVTNVGTIINVFGSGSVGGSGADGLTAQEVITPVDQYKGGYPFFQIGTWNLPILTVSIDTKYGYKSTSNPNTGVRSTNPGQTVDAWTYFFQENDIMIQVPLDRVPFFIAAGYVQFVGYT